MDAGFVWNPSNKLGSLHIVVVVLVLALLHCQKQPSLCNEMCHLVLGGPLSRHHMASVQVQLPHSGALFLGCTQLSVDVLAAECPLLTWLAYCHDWAGPAS